MIGQKGKSQAKAANRANKKRDNRAQKQKAELNKNPKYVGTGGINKHQIK